MQHWVGTEAIAHTKAATNAVRHWRPILAAKRPMIGRCYNAIANLRSASNEAGARSKSRTGASPDCGSAWCAS